MKILVSIFSMFFFSNGIAQQPRLLMPVATVDQLNNAYLTSNQKYVIASSAYPSETKIWDVKTKKLIYTIKENYIDRHSNSFSSDGRMLVTKDERNVNVWDIEEGKLIYSIKDKERFQIVTFSPDGKMLITSSSNGGIKIWNPTDGSFVYEIDPKVSTAYPLVVSPDGRSIAICNYDTILILDLQSRTILHKYQAAPEMKRDLGNAMSQNSPKDIKFSGNGQYLFSLYFDSTFSVWDTQKSRNVSLKKQVGDFSLNANGNKLAILEKARIQVYDIGNNEAIFESNSKNFPGESVTLSNTGTFILTTYFDQNGKYRAILLSAAQNKVIDSFSIGYSIFFTPTFACNDSFIVYNHPVKGLGIYQFNNGKLNNAADQYSWQSQSTDYVRSGDYSKVICLSDTMVRVLDLKNARIASTYSIAGGLVNAIKAVEVRQTADYEGKFPDTILIKDPVTGIRIHQLLIKNCKGKIFISDDGKYLLADEGWTEGYMILIDAVSGSIVKRMKKEGGGSLENVWFATKAGKIITMTGIGMLSVEVYDISSGRMTFEIRNYPDSLYDYANILHNISISPDERYLAALSFDKITIWDLRTKKKIKVLNSKEGFTVSEFSPNNLYFAYGTGAGEVVIFNTSRFEKVKSFRPHRSYINNLIFSDDSRKIITAEDEGSCNISEIDGKNLDKSIYSGIGNQLLYIDFKNDLYFFSDDVAISIFDGSSGVKQFSVAYTSPDEFIFIDKNNNYLVSPEISKKLAWRYKKDIYSFNQFDIKYNRPDKVLESLGAIFDEPDSVLINAYKKAYNKRLKRLNIDALAFDERYSIPEAAIVNKNRVEYLRTNSDLPLEITGNDSLFKLERFNVWVNDVPLFGIRGYPLSNNVKNSFDTTIKIELTQGQNFIEASFFNINGTESYKTPLQVNYQPQVSHKEKLYFIGIGIDEFRQSKYNLKYSTKDIRDLSNKLKEKYPNIIIDTLFNEEVTISNVKALKQKLLQTSVNDKVIISYSGHGMLSKDFDYYLSTYDVNFDKPEENGLPYDELESLLDSIPARKKLMLIDACHSGEVDKDDLIAMNSLDTSKIKRGLKPVAYKKEGQLGLKNSFELMQSLFVNVGKSTGATIISAAAGTQFALEGVDNLPNGVFTYCILETMNKYPTMKISELKKIVGDRVVEITKGLQKPTSRNETIAVDWNVWEH